MERARFLREPADILITTPESLFLLLTSNARDRLAHGGHGHHRRDPCARPGQAGRAPGAVAGAAGGAAAAGPKARQARQGARSSADSASGFRRRSGRSTKSRFSAAPRPRRRPRRKQGSRPTGGSDATYAAQADSTRAHAERSRSRAPRGVHRRGSRPAAFRPVTIVNASEKKQLDAADRSADRRHGAPRTAPIDDSERPGGAGQRCVRPSGRRSTRGCWS